MAAIDGGVTVRLGASIFSNKFIFKTVPSIIFLSNSLSINFHAYGVHIERHDFVVL
jgi:hypothetical protein